MTPSAVIYYMYVPTRFETGLREKGMARNNTETKEAATRNEESRGQAEAGTDGMPQETQQAAKDRMTGRLGPSSSPS